MGKFNGHEYTKSSVLEELALIERHSRDGSAIDASCACIQDKHLLNLAGLASEMVTLTSDPNEKAYYMELAATARKLRNEIIAGDFKKKGSPNKCEICLETHSAEECQVECSH